MPPLPRTALLKLPTQRRSVETVHAILDAAIRVLMNEGTEGFTTNRVAEVAGVSPGTLYQYFGSGEMLVAGIVERGIMDAEDLVRTALLSADDVPLEARLRSAMTLVTAALEPHAGLIAELVTAAPLLARHGITNVLEARIADLVRELLARHPGRYELRGGPAVVFIGVNGAIFVLLKWLCERPPHISREDLIDTMTGMFGGMVRERRDARPRTTTSTRRERPR